MSDSVREAFERIVDICDLPDDDDLLVWDDVNAVRSALSANGGEVMAFGNGDYTVEVGGYDDEHAVFVAPAIPPGRVGDLAEPTTGEDRHRLVPGERVMTFPTEAQAFAVAEAIAGRKINRVGDTHPAPSSVAVPEQREWNQVTGRDGFKYTEGWNACREAMLTAAPSPDHSGDANKVVDDLPGMWDQSDLSGGETDADHIADAGKVSFVDGLGAQRMTAEECKEGIEYIIHGDNIYWPLSDDDELRLIQAACGNGEFTYPQATPSVPENDNGVSSAYDSGYLDAMLYARVCCDRLDNPENTKDYRDCARFLDLIFKSEIDEAARLRTTDDKAEGV